MSNRTVTYTITRPVTGVPWPNARLSWQLIPGSFDGEASYPNFRADSTTDENGEGEVVLWANEEGSIESVYRVSLPSGETADFTLPAGVDPIDLTVLRALGVINADWTDELLSTAILNNPDLQGPPGSGGVPDGGTTGQVLTKLSDDDGDADWEDTTGSGDMLAATYDPQTIAGDAFARANHTGLQAIATVTGLQAALDAKAATTQAVTSFGVGTLADGEFLKRVGAALVGATPGGSGDMLASMYDPQTIEDDAFDLGTHTGALPESQITGLVADLAAKETAGAAATAQAFAIQRANHTGSQLASTVSDFAAAVRGVVLSGLSLATNQAIAAGDTLLAALGYLQKQITDHLANVSNPHSVTKSQVGLANADDTSDAGKPVSTATQTALDGKETSGAAATAQAYAIQRANHTGSQAASTISDFAATVRSTVLTGLSLATSQVIAATDTALVALGYLQAQITAHAALTAAHGATGAVMGTTNAQTVTGKRIQPRTATAAAGDITPALATENIVQRTGLTAAIAINAPTGTPVLSEVVVILLKDNGTTRALTWNATYKAVGSALPTTTTVSKRHIITAQYDGTDWLTLSAVEL